MAELLKCNIDINSLRCLESLFLEMNRRKFGMTEVEKFRNGVEKFLR